MHFRYDTASHHNLYTTIYIIEAIQFVSFIFHSILFCTIDKKILWKRVAVAVAAWRLVMQKVNRNNFIYENKKKTVS